MKNGVTVVFLIFAAFLFSSTAAYGLSLQNPSFDISLLRYEPFPAEAGRVVDVWLKIENSGAPAAVNVSIEDNYPYKVVDGSWDIGILPTAEWRILHGRIVIDDNAPDGEAKLRVKYSSEGISIVKELSFTIESKPEFSLSTIQTAVERGKVSEINITIEALKNRARDVMVDFSSNDFSIIGKTSFYLGDMEKGNRKSITLRVYPETESRVGSLEGRVSYVYGTSNEGVYEKSMGIELLSMPDIIAIPNQEGGKMKIKIVNSGYGTAEFLRFECDEGFKSYIGNLESDDFDTVEFVPATNNVSCKAIYMHDGIAEEKEFTFQFLPEKNESKPWLVYGIVVLFVVAILFLVRRK